MITNATARDRRTTDEPDGPNIANHDRNDPPEGRIEPAAACAAPSCWSREDLQVVNPDTNAEPVTLCRSCRKRYWGVSS